MATAKKKIEETAAKVADNTKKAVTKAKENAPAPVKKAAKATSTAAKKAAKATSTAAKKATSTAKKAASNAKKATEKVNTYVEFSGKQFSTADIADKVREAYKAEGGKARIKSIEIYVKPEENAAYYVINGNAEGKKIDL